MRKKRVKTLEREFKNSHEKKTRRNFRRWKREWNRRNHVKSKGAKVFRTRRDIKKRRKLEKSR